MVAERESEKDRENKKRSLVEIYMLLRDDIGDLFDDELMI